MKTNLLLIMLFIIQSLIFSQEVIITKVSTGKKYNKLFYHHKWVGGDGAHSIKISNNKILWTFGDTLIGKVNGNKRENTIMINNSLGIQTHILSNKSNIKFYWKKDNNNKDSAYFPTHKKDTWFWPFQPVIVNNKLYIFAKKYVKTKDNILGFKETASKIFEIKNYLDSPEKWKVKYIKNALDFGCYAFKRNHYVYIFDTKLIKKPTVNRYLFLSRVKEKDFTDFSKWKFYAGNNRYLKNIKNAKALFDEVGSEFSIHYNKSLGKYIAVYTHMGLSKKIILRFSNNLENSWSKQKVIYKCQEPNWKKEYFSYAAKVHPELASLDNKLIITYAVNSFDFWDLFKDARIYFPKFVEIYFSLQSAE